MNDFLKQSKPCALVATSARAEVFTYNVKSKNLTAAMQVQFYEATDGGGGFPGGEVDLHAVHGIETSDGGYVVVGGVHVRS